MNKTKEEVKKYESYTIKIQKHLPISFVYYIIYANGEIKENLFEYFGLDAPKKLYEKLREDALHIAQEYLDKKTKMKELSKTVFKLKNIKSEDEEKEKLLNKLIEFLQNRKIVDKAKIKYKKEGKDMNRFYENYIYTLENVEKKNEYEEKIFNKFIEFTKNRKYNIDKKEELYTELSNLVMKIKFEHSNESANKMKVLDHKEREF